MADPVEVAPDVYTVLFENDRVRLFEVREAPGVGSAMHSHPDYVIYAVSGGKVKFTSGSGETAELEINAGNVCGMTPRITQPRSSAPTISALLFELK